MSHASSTTRKQLEQQIASMGVRNPVLQHLDQVRGGLSGEVRGVVGRPR